MNPTASEVLLLLAEYVDAHHVFTSVNPPDETAAFTVLDSAEVALLQLDPAHLRTLAAPTPAQAKALAEQWEAEADEIARRHISGHQESEAAANQAEGIMHTLLACASELRDLSGQEGA